MCVPHSLQDNLSKTPAMERALIRSDSNQAVENAARADARLSHVLDKVDHISSKQGQLLNMHVEAVQYARAYIEERVGSASQEARTNAEALGLALSQVRVDQLVLKEHLSAHLQTIADNAREEIKRVSREHQISQTYEIESLGDRITELDNLASLNEDAIAGIQHKLNTRVHEIECAVARSLEVVKGVELTIHELRDQIQSARPSEIEDRVGKLESIITGLLKLEERVQRLDNQCAASDVEQRVERLEARVSELLALEMRVVERIDRQTGTNQVALASAVSRLSGRMDRYDARQDRTSERLVPMIENVRRQLSVSIENSSADTKASLAVIERKAVATESKFDLAVSALKEQIQTQASELLTLQTNLAQLATFSHHPIEQVSRLSMDELEQQVSVIKATQAQQTVMIQQLSSCDRTADTKFDQVFQAVVQQDQRQNHLQNRLDTLDQRDQANALRQHQLQAHFDALDLADRNKEERHTHLMNRIDALDRIYEDRHLQLQSRLNVRDQADQLNEDRQNHLQTRMDALDRADRTVEDRIEAWFWHNRAVADARLIAAFDGDDTSATSSNPFDDEADSVEQSTPPMNLADTPVQSSRVAEANTEPAPPAESGDVSSILRMLQMLTRESRVAQTTAHRSDYQHLHAVANQLRGRRNPPSASTSDNSPLNTLGSAQVMQMGTSGASEAAQPLSERSASAFDHRSEEDAMREDANSEIGTIENCVDGPRDMPLTSGQSSTHIRHDFTRGPRQHGAVEHQNMSIHQASQPAFRPSTIRAPSSASVPRRQRQPTRAQRTVMRVDDRQGRLEGARTEAQEQMRLRVEQRISGMRRQ